jgi:glucose/arabinose dehydrogenase
LIGRATVALLGLIFLWPTQAVAAQADREARVIIDGLEFPTGIAFSSSGEMFVNERPGRIRVVRDGKVLAEPLATIPTTTDGETGLLGIAIPPDEDAHPYVYVFVTDPGGETNSVQRVPIEGGEPKVVVSDLPAGGYHNGGGLGFDSANSLYVSNGEQHASERAQDPNVLGGKVYRFEPDGGIPSSNPFGSPANATFAFGLRNPYGLTIDPITDVPFVTENGPSSDDEINRIVPAGNYGWPLVQGNGEVDAQSLEGEYQPPLLNYPEIVVPTGIAIAGVDDVSPEVAGDLFFGTYGEGTIHKVRLDDSRRGAVSDEVFLDVGEPVIALAWGPGGLYFSTLHDIRFIPLADTSGGQPTEPPEEVQSAGSDRGGDPTLSIVVVALLALLAAVTFASLIRSRRAVKRPPE